MQHEFFTDFSRTAGIAGPSSLSQAGHACSACADDLQALGHNVGISHSAGRYLCNYIYFKSLQLCSNVPNWHALFVHVPPLELIGHDEEVAFAVDLFDALVQKVQATVPVVV